MLESEAEALLDTLDCGDCNLYRFIILIFVEVS